MILFWHCGVVIVTTTQLHSAKSELRFCARSNLDPSMSKIWDGKNLWQWFQLEIRHKCLSSVNHSVKKTIHHHHHHHQYITKMFSLCALKNYTKQSLHQFNISASTFLTLSKLVLQSQNK